MHYCTNITSFLIRRPKQSMAITVPHMRSVMWLVALQSRRGGCCSYKAACPLIVYCKSLSSSICYFVTVLISLAEDRRVLCDSQYIKHLKLEMKLIYFKITVPGGCSIFGYLSISTSFTIGVEGSPGTFILRVRPHQKPKYSRVINASRRGEARINDRAPMGTGARLCCIFCLSGKF